MNVRSYHKKTVNQRLQEQVEKLAARLHATQERNEALSVANTKLVHERDARERRCGQAEDSLRKTKRRLAASLALNVVLVVALAVVLVVL